ncbi:hypothetical protein PoB_000926000 [Plakobranchus ocellatus]|uniref:Uncharacterized protein n=1 Tax=Plakobranchus ocellatus TaxID=259542 RepID=A0AAV3YJ46_9GAST|nr:hypothetical protein PoB_000926000 [Plakobranchus ocellatus]
MIENIDKGATARIHIDNQISEAFEIQRVDTLLEKKIIDGLKDAQSGNQGQEEETGIDQKQDGWMTSGKQQVHNGRGRHKIGGNRRHLQRATSCSGWTKPPSNQVTK